MSNVTNMVTIVAMLAIASISLAEDAELGFNAGADYLGKYIWRGQNLSDDPVFQPSAGISYGPMSLSLWGSMDTTNINGNSGDFSELDTTLSLAGDIPGIEGLSYTAGMIYYNFPGTAYADTAEVYAGFSLALPLSPSITIYRDLDEAKGTYYSFGAGCTFEKIADIGCGTPVGMIAIASIGYANSAYNKYYWGVGSSEWQDLTLALSFPVAAGKWTIAPKTGYSKLLSRDIRNSDAYGTASDNFFTGIGASIRF